MSNSQENKQDNYLINKSVLVISGPTASGKSSLAVKLAQKLDGEVISADSMQIYKGLDIATAKISTEEMEAIPHHLLDIREAGERYSVADFLEDSRKLIIEIFSRKKLPIVCGGTGQYITALLDGLQFLEEDSDLSFRQEIRRKILDHGLERAHKRLAELDPQAGERIAPQDEKRIVRFFEVYKKSGMTSSEVYAYSRAKGPDFPFLAYVLWPPRDLLYDKINRRTELIFDLGIEEELQAILDRHEQFSKTQAFQAIGYKEVLPYIKGEISREEAIANLAQSTRRYAKRQYTLYRQREDILKVESPNPEEAFRIIYEDFISRRVQ